MNDIREEVNKVRRFIRKYSKQDNKHIKYNWKTIYYVYHIINESVIPTLSGKILLLPSLNGIKEDELNLELIWKEIVKLIETIEINFKSNNIIKVGKHVPYKFRGVDYGTCIIKEINNDEVLLISETNAEIRTSIDKLEKLLKPYYK